MARKSKVVTLTDSDKKLTFKITQMPALRLEKWINRLLFALAKSGGKDLNLDGNLPIDKMFQAGGVAGLIKLLGGVDYQEAEPLYDELLTCAVRVEDRAEFALDNDMLDGLIDDVRTLYKLRLEILKLNFDFLGTGGNSPADAPPDITIPKNILT
jgi:hypothetical protein